MARRKRQRKHHGQYGKVGRNSDRIMKLQAEEYFGDHKYPTSFDGTSYRPRSPHYPSSVRRVLSAASRRCLRSAQHSNGIKPNEV